MFDGSAMDNLRDVFVRDLPGSWQSGTPEEPTDSKLYRAFQEVFRGSFQEIAGRHERYVPYVMEAVAATGGDKKFLDVGCGRGEFMRALADRSVEVVCVELDEDLASVARSIGLDVRISEGVQFIEQCDDASLAGVSANSVVEHMRPADFLLFIRLLGRKIAPGGCVILETNNPECTTAMGTFWLDLTHVRPYHPLCVGFYLGQLGFERLQTMYTGLVPPQFRTPAEPSFNYADYATIGFRRS